MSNLDFVGLYESYCRDKVTSRGNDEYVCCCPFDGHQDSNPSFTYNISSGYFKCWGCGEKGTGYDFAKKINHPNPYDYFIKNSIDNNYTKTYTPKPKFEQTIQVATKDVSEQFNRFKINLKKNMNKFPIIWNKDLIDDLGIGLDDSNNWCNT